MIRTQELRLGNLLQFEDGRICTVTRLIADHRSLQVSYIWPDGDMKYSYVDLEYTYGIPLTPEWIARLGFKPNPDMPWLMENGALMCNTGNHWIWHWSGSVIKDIKCVHELQNVMFALSGRELEVRS